MQTGEFFSMSESRQEQQHNNANAGDDEFDFASIFTDDPSWLASIPCIPSSPTSSAQLAAVAAEAMSPGSALSTSQEALDEGGKEEMEGGNNPGRRATVALPSISDEPREQPQTVQR